MRREGGSSFNQTGNQFLPNYIPKLSSRGGGSHSRGVKDAYASDVLKSPNRLVQLNIGNNVGITNHLEKLTNDYYNNVIFPKEIKESLIVDNYSRNKVQLNLLKPNFFTSSLQ